MFGYSIFLILRREHKVSLTISTLQGSFHLHVHCSFQSLKQPCNWPWLPETPFQIVTLTLAVITCICPSGSACNKICFQEGKYLWCKIYVVICCKNWTISEGLKGTGLSLKITRDWQCVSPSVLNTLCTTDFHILVFVPTGVPVPYSEGTCTCFFKVFFTGDDLCLWKMERPIFFPLCSKYFSSVPKWVLPPLWAKGTGDTCFLLICLCWQYSRTCSKDHLYIKTTCL